jgi:hypothetical protein
MNKKLDEMKDWFESEEGQKSLERFAERMNREHDHQMRWTERFKKWAEPDMDTAIEKLCSWYESDKYRDREYKKGYEPRESLLWLAFEYAKENCKECDDEQYLNGFTGAAYYIGSYVIQVMHGQGSVLRIDKIKGPIKPSRRERIILMIEDRIKTEHKKHSRSLPDAWARIAAGKIFTTLEELENSI